MQKLITFSLLSIFVLTSISLFAQEEYGLASYYGDEFDGRATAYGETYHKNELTAAHKKYPKGTMLKVTRIDNNKSVTVRVNDKGPFVKGRIIDLSRAAAEKIGLIDADVAEVKIKVIGKKSHSEIAKVEEKPEAKVTKSQEEVTVTPKGYSDDIAAKKAEAEKEAIKQAKLKKIKERQARKAKAAAAHKKMDDINKKKAAEKKAAEKPKVAPKPKTKKGGVAVHNAKGIYKIIKGEAAPSGYTVQVFSTSSYNLMEEEIAKLKAKWFKGFVLSVEDNNGKPKFNVGLKEFEKMAAAKNYNKNLSKKYKIKGFVLPAAAPTTKEDQAKNSTTKLNIQKVAADTYGVQVASLNDFKSFLKEYSKLDKKGFENILLGIKKDGTFKAVLGTFSSKEEADTYRKNLLKKYKTKGFVINLNSFE